MHFRMQKHTFLFALPIVHTEASVIRVFRVALVGIGENEAKRMYSVTEQFQLINLR